MLLSKVWCGLRCGWYKALRNRGIGPYSSRSLATLNGEQLHFKIHPDVSQALKNNSPVVALESTIITHGMPYPENYRTALDVENILREKDVVPATIAIINGTIHVGLTNDDLLNLSTSESTLKISRRGLPSSIAFGQTGGTTVSATMLIAYRCGIPIFVTGGVGGVHRGAENTMDISSDLTELGRTPITVISAGVKSILDIPKTLEYLETQGVTVVTYGDTNDFPAFFTPKSGYKSQTNVRTSSQAAKLIKASKDLNMNSGCLIAAPIPEKYAASGYLIEDAIQKSLVEAESLSISGAEVTPFILQKVNEITGGESLESNVALIKHNAAVGADIALELSKITSDRAKVKTQTKKRPIVIGATNIDVISKPSSDILYDGPSNPAETSCTLGGVGRNIAESLSRIGDDPVFLTLLGDDRLGMMAETEMKEYLDTSFTQKMQDQNSGMYVAIMDKNGSLKIGTENLSINDRFTIDIVQKHEELISQAAMVCIDANLPVKTINYICGLCKNCNTELFFEPTGTLKAHRPFTGDAWKAISYLTPNLQEFHVIMSEISGNKVTTDFSENVDCDEKMLQSILAVCQPLVEHVNCLVVTLARYGVATFIQDESQGIIGRHYPLTSMPEFEFSNQPIINVSGSGDSFAASFIHGLLERRSIDISTKMGMIAAQFSLRARQAISPNLSSKLFQDLDKLDWKSYKIDA